MTNLRNKSLRVRDIWFAAGSILWSVASFAGPNESDCQAVPEGTPAPGASRSSPSISDCKGVLQPPRVGDWEILEFPSQTGETPVIRPGELPPQSSAAEPSAGTPAGEYTLDDIVQALSESFSNAARIAALDDAPTVRLVDISVLFQGAGRAVLDTALQQHNEPLNELRAALFEHEGLQNELQERGVDKPEIVAVALATDGSVVVFARHP
jgi:hypothetical protein